MTWPAVDVLLWFALALNLATTLFAALTGRFLMHDQANFTFNTLESGPYLQHFLTLRIFHGLLDQGVRFILQVLAKEDDVALFLTVSGIGHWLFPVAGLAWTLWLCRRIGAVDLYIPVLLSFALATQSSMANVGGLVPDNLVLFWPALILVIFTPVFTYRSLVIVAVIFFSWCFSHESAILCMGFIGLTLALRLRRLSSLDFRPLLFALLACFAGCAWIAYRVFRPNHVETQYFVANAVEKWGPFRLATIPILGALTLYLLVRRRPITMARLFFAVTSLTALFVSPILWRTPGYIFFWESVRGRTSMLPVALLLATLAVWAKLNKRPWYEGNSASRSLVIGSTAIVLTLAALNDALGDAHWIRSRTAILSMLDRSPGCTELSLQDPAWAELANEGLSGSTLRLLSVLLQQKADVSKILLWKNPHHHSVRDFCCALSDKYLTAYEDGRRLPIHYFDFSEVLQAMQKQGLACKSSLSVTQ